MLRRLFLVFLPSLTASSSFANSSAWNCEQNKQTNEWVCVGADSEKIAPQSTTPATVNVAPPEKPMDVEATEELAPITISETVKNEQSTLGILPPAFNTAQEQIFNALTAQNHYQEQHHHHHLINRKVKL